MQRLQRFVQNAGAMGVLQSVAVVIVMCIAIRYDLTMGHWVITLPVLLLAVLVAYVVRNVLVDHFGVMRWVMNGLAAAGIAVVVFSGGFSGSGSLWLRAALAGGIGLYMGCYFFMLSDPRVGRTG